MIKEEEINLFQNKTIYLLNNRNQRGIGSISDEGCLVILNDSYIGKNHWKSLEKIIFKIILVKK